MKSEHREEYSNRPIWWAVLGFACLFAAWTSFFVVAARHKVAEVPLAIGSAR